ncbi:hypothetical protein ABZ093_26030 [Streptomyces cyaneofuscatus]|uniref:hypothetical protein n=1 Tax=Streptomyces cyaneofuscatus TaxID=66883 RepID=UPI0033BA1F73
MLVPYAIPDRDCGGASQGGAPDIAAYDAWIGEFAQGSARPGHRDPGNRTPSPLPTASPPRAARPASPYVPAPDPPCVPPTRRPGSTSTVATPAGTRRRSRRPRSELRGRPPAATASSSTWPTSAPTADERTYAHQVLAALGCPLRPRAGHGRSCSTIGWPTVDATIAHA